MTKAMAFLASVSLIQALGGGWDASQLPSQDSLRRGRGSAAEAVRER
jgi:hypothetical protein